MVRTNQIFEYPMASTACVKPFDMSYLCRTSWKFAPRDVEMSLQTLSSSILVIDSFGMKSVVSREIVRLTPSGASQALFFRAFLPAHIKRRGICQSTKPAAIR
jgi:hypothetical protein